MERNMPPCCGDPNPKSDIEKILGPNQVAYKEITKVKKCIKTKVGGP